MSKENPLIITIDNQKDIELFEFTNAMASLNNQYYAFLNSQGATKSNRQNKLYIKQIAKGSIIVELWEKAPLLLPAIPPILAEFSGYLVNVLNFLTDKEVKLIYNFLTKKDWVDFKKILEPIVNTKGNLTLNIGNNHNTYNYLEAAAAQNQCDRQIKKLELSAESLIKENVELNLYKAINSNISESMKGNMGIIAEISNKPKVLSYATDRIRYDLVSAEKNPFNYTYIVDVEIKLKNTTLGYEDHKNIKEYEILKLHGAIYNENQDLLECMDA